jgi:hypothetical protein
MGRIILFAVAVLLNICFNVRSAENTLQASSLSTNERKNIPQNTNRLSSHANASLSSNHDLHSNLFKVPAKIPRSSVSLETYSVSPNLFKEVLVGTGTSGFSGDGGQATSAQISATSSWADSSGNIYFTEMSNFRIRKVNTGGIVSTMGGSAIQSTAGTGGPIGSVNFYWPFSVMGDAACTMLFMSDRRYVWKYIFSTDIISVFAHAAGQSPGYAGDGGPAISARLNQPAGLWLTTGGVLYIADFWNNRIRKVSSGIITTVVGSGTTDAPGSYTGDGGPALSATLNQPFGVYVNTNGEIYVADTENRVIRFVNTSSIISTIPGITGYYTFTLIGDTVGNIFFTDETGCKLRVVDTLGIVSVLFGNSCGYSAGISTRTASLGSMNSIWIDTASRFYLCDVKSIYRSLLVSSPTSQPSRQPTGQPTRQPTLTLATSLKDGLIAFYPFDGNANDHSGNNLDGIAINTVPSPDRFGNPSRSYYFDGTSSYVKVMNGKPFQLNMWNSVDFTFAFWIKPTLNSWNVWFDTQISGTSGYALGSEITGRDIVFTFREYSSNTWKTYTFGDFTSYNQWHHFVMTKRGKTFITYMDGSLTFQINTTYTRIKSNGALPFKIGNCQENSRYFLGSMDDVFIFNRSITPDEVRMLYNFDAPTSQPSRQPTAQPTRLPTGQPTRQPTGQPTRQPTSQPTRLPTAQPTRLPTGQPTRLPTAQPTRQPTSQPTRQPTSQPTRLPTAQPTRLPTGQPTRQPTLTLATSLKTGLLAFYPFDGNANDHSGNNLDGIAINTVPSPDRFGNPSRSYYFDGTSSYVKVMNGNPFQLNMWNSMDFTFAFWIKPTLKSWNVWFDTQISGTSGYALNTDSSGRNIVFTFREYSTNSWQTMTFGDWASYDQWHHFVMSKKGKTFTSYMDGSMTFRINTTYTRIKSNGALPFKIGNSVETLRYFLGSMDDVFIFNRSITPDEVRMLYNFDGPTSQPTMQPTRQPSSRPTRQPTVAPSSQPTTQPSSRPSSQPSSRPSMQPTNQPSAYPTNQPTSLPSSMPSSQPSSVPSVQPSCCPSG